MERAQYIKLREENNVEIIYEYYKENFKPEKHSPKLGLGEFIEYIMMWPNRQGAFNVATEYYDVKFNVLHVPLEDKIMFI